MPGKAAFFVHHPELGDGYRPKPSCGLVPVGWSDFRNGDPGSTGVATRKFFQDFDFTASRFARGGARKGVQSAGAKNGSPGATGPRSRVRLGLLRTFSGCRARVDRY